MPRHTPSSKSIFPRIRNRTGLRNKQRTGRNTYKAKGRGDFYGKWDNGICKAPERIAK